eukprot:jgi/Astpho2/6195/Aster-03605
MYLASQGAANAVPPANASFVTRTGSQLLLDGQPFTYVGANSYYLLTMAAGVSTRPLVTSVFQQMAATNTSVLRTWAFNDYTNFTGPSLQPELGTLNAYSNQQRLQKWSPPANHKLARHFQFCQCRNGLDYVVSQAAVYNIKLILTLTNYFADYGGMQAYVQWINPGINSTVQAFYQNPTIQAAYLDFVTAIVLRKNSITGVLYRDDPTILAWDIANEPSNPGDETGDILQAWIEMASAYVKHLDPNHLVYTATIGYFGATTPSLVYLNGNQTEFSPYTTVPYNSLCNGNDWARNIATPTVDLAGMHYYVDYGPSEAQYTQSLIQGHMQVAQSANKPMIIDEVSGQRPISARNDFLSRMFAQVQAAGSPVVGVNVWLYVAPSYADYDGFSVYSSEAPYLNDLPASPYPFTQGLANAQNAVFHNYAAADLCARRLFKQSDRAVGWDQTLSIIRCGCAHQVCCCKDNKQRSSTIASITHACYSRLSGYWHLIPVGLLKELQGTQVYPLMPARDARVDLQQ